MQRRSWKGAALWALLAGCSSTVGGTVADAGDAGDAPVDTGAIHDARIDAGDGPMDAGTPPPRECGSNRDCAANEVCEYEAGCGATRGRCHSDACQSLPVAPQYCGCDGMTLQQGSACLPDRPWRSMGACPGTPDAGVDVPADRSTMPRDVPPGGCLRAADCTLSPLFPDTFGRGWSCIAGQCTWELRAGRVCELGADGCFTCDDDTPRSCPGLACGADLRREHMELERLYCARDFIASLESCSGGFVRLDDGTVCTVTEAPTGAIRHVLACGPCEVVFTPR